MILHSCSLGRPWPGLFLAAPLRRARAASTQRRAQLNLAPAAHPHQLALSCLPFSTSKALTFAHTLLFSTVQAVAAPLCASPGIRANWDVGLLMENLLSTQRETRVHMILEELHKAGRWLQGSAGGGGGMTSSVVDVGRSRSAPGGQMHAAGMEHHGKQKEWSSNLEREQLKGWSS